MTHIVEKAEDNASVESYVNGFVDHYLEFMTLIEAPIKKYEHRLTVDCSNGVGAISMPIIVERINEHLKIDLVNTRTTEPEKLNNECGADFVVNKQRMPTEVNSGSSTKVCCMDGDGDRCIYFHKGETKPVVISGDKIFCFLMMYIVEKLEMLGIRESVNHCLINTAYTNSQALRFLKANDITTI